jgi:Domain of unknown function (DUF6968)
MDLVAERVLVALYPDGESVHVHLRIGRPVPHPNGDWCCEVAAEGLRLWRGPKPFRGVDSWQALLIGLQFLRDILSREAERGAVYHWEGGEHPIRVDELFGLREIS